MWHWQHKKIDKLAIMSWGKLFFISLIGHISFLFLIFFIYTDSIGILHLIVEKKGSPVSVAPVLFMNKMTSSVIKNNSTQKNVGVQKNVGAQVNKSLPAKRVSPNSKQKVDVKKKCAKKIVTKKRAKNNIIKDKKIKKKTVKSCMPEKKKIEKTPVKQVQKTVKPAQKRKKIEPEKVLEKALKKTPERVLEKKSKVVSRNDQLSDQLLVAQKKKPLDNNIDNNSGKKEFTDIGSNNTQLDVRHENLKSELAREWSAPVGIDSDKGCTVKIGVDPQGKTNFFEIVDSSGVLLFDISVQSICKSKQWPSWLHNTCFSMTFQ